MSSYTPEEVYFAFQRGEKIYQVLGSDVSSVLESGDLLAVQRGDTVKKFEIEVVENLPPPPWDGWAGPAFHVITSADAVTVSKPNVLRPKPFQAWKKTGNDWVAYGDLTSVPANSEYAILVDPEGDCRDMFKNNRGNWEFGAYTDTSAVKKFSYMFFGCFDFNADVKDWNVGNASNFAKMFQKCYVFNQDVGNWDTKMATNMESMFENCTEFYQDLSGWCVPSVTNKSGFAKWTSMPNEFLPVWGTCPP